MYRRVIATLTAAIATLLLSVTTAQADPAVIRLATTTSTDNSGLLAKLLPPFEQLTGTQVHVIAVGTGKALRMGQDGDADVVLVHARAAEDAFMAAGYGVNRRDVMYNDFVIVGPAADPAGIKGLKDAAAALERIASSQSVFVSRGDDSGTDKKEKALWKDAGIKPEGKWYREAGQGMGKVLQMAAELDAYTLADRGTWLAYTGKLPLTILTAGDTRLFNPYGIIAVNPERFPDINYLGAMSLIAWVTSPAGQAVIRDFTINGQPLFVPVAVTGKAGTAAKQE
jgi:tungstate transport system substrate-binding protein